jgi:hypothetical protein
MYQSFNPSNPAVSNTDLRVYETVAEDGVKGKSGKQ